MRHDFDQSFISDIISFEQHQSLCHSHQLGNTKENSFKKQEDNMSEQDQVKATCQLVCLKEATIKNKEVMKKYQQLNEQSKIQQKKQYLAQKKQFDKQKQMQKCFNILTQLESRYNKDKNYQIGGLKRKKNYQQYEKNELIYQRSVQKYNRHKKELNENSLNKQSEKCQIQTHLNSKSQDSNLNDHTQLILNQSQEMILILSTQLGMLNSNLITSIIPFSVDIAESYLSANFYRLSNQLKYKIYSIEKNNNLMFEQNNQTLVLLLRSYFFKVGVNLWNDDIKDDDFEIFSYCPSKLKPIITGTKWAELKSDY